MTTLTWVGIGLCLAHSACFSGLNLAVFGISRLRLEADAATGGRDAARVLRLRENSSFLLATILWGNVAANTLLALLADSMMTGVAAFFFATFGITIVGEILPQAYFSRNAMIIASKLTPFLRLYQTLLYPLSRPTGLLLDAWLGKEGPHFFREREIREFVKMHVEAAEAEIGHLEGVGALNFLALDDLLVTTEGEPIHPDSIVPLTLRDGAPTLPTFEPSVADPFVKAVARSGQKWVVLTAPDGRPWKVLNANRFLRDLLLQPDTADARIHCHTPVVCAHLERILLDADVRPVLPRAYVARGCPAP